MRIAVSDYEFQVSGFKLETRNTRLETTTRLASEILLSSCEETFFSSRYADKKMRGTISVEG